LFTFLKIFFTKNYNNEEITHFHPGQGGGLEAIYRIISTLIKMGVLYSLAAERKGARKAIKK
jgi:hypothetical protein